MSKASVARQWDEIAKYRCAQIASGKDISHDCVLIPALFDIVRRKRAHRILDVGSGCGFLSARLSRLAREVIGIDISQEMIREAQERFGTYSNVSFLPVSIEQFGESAPKRFDLAVSNMALSAMEDHVAVFKAVCKLLEGNGEFIFSIIHPCFWNSYRQAESSQSFNYWKDHSVTAPFKITMEKRPRFRTTYFHRSLSSYLNALAKTGFVLQEAIEPMVPIAAPEKYRKAFRFPRFLIISAKKT